MTATQYRYQAQYKPNQLIIGHGQTAVITGWTVKEAVAKHLQPQEYAVIGQLYSPTRGVNLLIRNLLLNPHVRYLVCLNATKEDNNAGAVECLQDFFHEGFERGVCDTGTECWVIRSKIKGYIDIQVDRSALETLQDFIICQEVKSIDAAVVQAKWHSRITLSPWGEKIEFPVPIIKPTVLPGPRYGHRIEGQTIAETWVKIIHRIKTTGTIRPTRYDSQCLELVDLMAVVTNEPDGFYFPEPNYLPISREFLREYTSQILEDSKPQEGIKYSYGHRLRSHFEDDQIKQVIWKLIKDIDSASAVMNLWDTKEDYALDASPPCLNHIWLRVVDNELSLTATFRSNDMFSAWPANAMQLVALQRYIRDKICDCSKYDLKMGPLITISQSAHIYNDTWSSAQQVIDEHYKRICKKIDYSDPSGNFLVEVNDSQIVVSQTTPGNGVVIGCYCGTNALKLIREICAATPSLRPDHVGYLGIELHRAMKCLQAGIDFVQDSPPLRGP